MIKINTNHIGDLPLVVNGTEDSSILELDGEAGLTVNGKIYYDQIGCIRSGRDSAG